MSDWKTVVGSVAPALAGLLGGPLAAGVVGLVAERVLGKSSGDPVADERALANAVQAGLTPEMREKLLEIQAELIRADVRKVEVAADDRKDARASAVASGMSGRVFALSCLLLAVALGGEVAVLFIGYPAHIPDLVVGRVLGLMDAVAMMVLSYWFGTTAGSQSKNDAIGALTRRV